jgi:hypothetical protein
MTDEQVREKIGNSAWRQGVLEGMRQVWQRATKQTNYRVWRQVWQIREDARPIAHFVQAQAEDYDEQRPGARSDF